ncbi:MAG TPA: acyclic terpene utilization AtuA family protein [Steroidobacteraceae bacterium]|nr:acyclic terpene utilization AtuA family protein [Steroidobacteraceae bacterium]
MAEQRVRIGCGCAFWGDSAAGPAQLVRSGEIDFLVLDYLSEITLSLLARARRRRPELGYTPDFVSEVMRPLAAEIASRRIRVIANAGGVNPRACGDAVQKLLQELGVQLSVAVISGDDLSGELGELRAAGTTDTEGGGPLPQEVLSANAYLGAFPIATALEAGADIVITGRCADSALALGPLIHRFGWTAQQLDRLAMGSLAGHVLECGPQATGGIVTDWRAVAAGWADMGYPIAECSADGTFILTKPQGTGGVVNAANVAEQIVYEVHDPARYVLPDVVCDFSRVTLEDLGNHRVRVSNARGLPATSSYKASLTYPDGYRCTATLMIVGTEAVPKAQQVAAAILARTRRLFGERGWSDFRATSVEVLGSEAMYGPHARTHASREVILKVAVAHAQEAPLELFAREIFPSATSMAQGITGFAGGRPAVQPIVRLASCLVPKARVHAQIEIADRNGLRTLTLPPAPTASAASPPPAAAQPEWPGVAAAAQVPESDGYVEVPLVRLAHGRSGDKGDIANVAVLARRPAFVPLLARALTAQVVRGFLAHLVEGEVERYDWPGLNGWNFVLHRALGGGGIASLRYDPQGKSYAQILMDLPVRVPRAWLEPAGPLGESS